MQFQPLTFQLAPTLSNSLGHPCEYRSLCCASGTGMDEFIFGQNLENQLKGISVTSKLTTKKQQNGQQANFQTSYQTRYVFLGGGKGQRAHPHQRNQFQQRGKKIHH